MAEKIPFVSPSPKTPPQKKDYFDEWPLFISDRQREERAKSHSTYYYVTKAARAAAKNGFVLATKKKKKKQKNERKSKILQGGRTYLLGSLSNDELAIDTAKAPIRIEKTKDWRQVAIDELTQRLNKKDKRLKLVLFSCAGHGGIDQPKELAPNDYSTYRWAKGKFYHHAQRDANGKVVYQNGKAVLLTYNGKLATFHNNGYFYEGVENRIYQAALIAAMQPLIDSGELMIIKVADDVLDTPLQERVDFANKIHAQIQAYNKGKKPNERIATHYNSIHFNAANTRAQGICIFTSEGQTNSDIVADAIHKELSAHFPNHRLGRTIASVRTEQSPDGDPDHEENFYVLRETNCTATLPELGFFDNFAEACLIHYNSEYKQRVILSMAHAFARCFGLNLSLLPPMPTGLFTPS